MQNKTILKFRNRTFTDLHKTWNYFFYNKTLNKLFFAQKFEKIFVHKLK